jgi:hypothetical protein
MLNLSDDQLAVITDIAKTLPIEKRDAFLRRIGAMAAFRLGPGISRCRPVGPLRYRFAIDH